MLMPYELEFDIDNKTSDFGHDVTVYFNNACPGQAQYFKDASFGWEERAYTEFFEWGFIESLTRP